MWIKLEGHDMFDVGSVYRIDPTVCSQNWDYFKIRLFFKDSSTYDLVFGTKNARDHYVSLLEKKLGAVDLLEWDKADSKDVVVPERAPMPQVDYSVRQSS